MTPEETDRAFTERLAGYPLALRCIRCGLCLPACPTYEITGREADSPRGRIYLLRRFAEGELDLTPEAEKHLLRCILCRACETACPSGVRMGELMESYRATVGSRLAGPKDMLARFFLRHVIPYRGRIAGLADLLSVCQRTGLHRLIRLGARCLFKKLATLQDFDAPLEAPEVRHIETHEKKEDGLTALGKRRMRVGLFLGCIASEWFAGTQRAAARVLRQNGCEVFIPDGQTCCGALHRQAGLAAEADELFRRNREAFSGARLDAVVVTAAGCGRALKEGRPGCPGGLGVPVRDIMEFLDEIGLVPPPGRIEKRVAYQQPCQLVHGQRVDRAPVERSLRAIPQLRLVPLDGSDRCCGGGGAYNLTHPEMAKPLLERKVKAILLGGAEIVVTGDPGCLLQIRAALPGKKVEVLHPVELLDRSYRMAH